MAGDLSLLQWDEQYLKSKLEAHNLMITLSETFSCFNFNYALISDQLQNF